MKRGSLLTEILVLEEGRVTLHNWDLVGGGARSMGREGFRFPMRFLPGG